MYFVIGSCRRPIPEGVSWTWILNPAPVVVIGTFVVDCVIVDRLLKALVVVNSLLVTRVLEVFRVVVGWAVLLTTWLELVD